MDLAIGWLALATVAVTSSGMVSPAQLSCTSDPGPVLLAEDQRSGQGGAQNPGTEGKGGGVVVVPGAPQAVDVNRPQSVFDCELPMGEKWYGSRQRCLAYMCAGENVYNEYIFDADGRRRRNPCYGQSATELPSE